MIATAPRPPVIERNSVAYENSSAWGTLALMTCIAPSVSIPRTRPRRPLRSRFTSPRKSSGTWIATVMIGSRRAGLA